MPKAAAKKVTHLKHVSFSEFRGKPMIVFGDPEDRFPFQFGPSKAARLLLALEENGAESVMESLRQIVGDNDK